ncbi:MAG: NAD(+) synthase [Bacteroidota bacterium]|nr:NAD(+) synthase [Bacteroidota bacterium]
MQTEKIISYIANWLAEYAKRSGAAGFVVGVSGGIDSAVSSVLGAKSNLPILCVEMPIHQSFTQMKRASKHINWLKENWKNAKSVETDLTPLLDAFITQMPISDTAEETELALINTRARFRMTTLYYFAQLNNYLVLGTGNKVEDFGIGFFTKYGDGGVDLSPIADLKKSEVFALGKELGVIEDILIAPPTDGLWNDDRTDEDQIGASYPELEWAMEFKGDLKNLNERQKDVLEIYKHMRKANLHKMQVIPVCNIPEELK